MLVEKQAFSSRDDAMAKIVGAGLSPIEYRVTPDNFHDLREDRHRHRRAVTAYVLDGCARVRDSDNRLCEAYAGDKISVEAGEWHSEELSPYSAILGVEPQAS